MDIEKATNEFLKALKGFENETLIISKHRERMMSNLEYASQDDVEEFKESVASRQRVLNSLQAAEAALKNSKASFEKFAKQIDKDMTVLSKFRESEPLTKRHPFIQKKIAILQSAIQQVEFLEAEIIKMADSINWKLDKKGIERLPELRQDIDALSASYTTWEGRNIGASRRALQGQAEELERL